MKHNLKKFLFAVVMIPVLMAPQVAEAQMNNRPYSFKGSSGGGVGMSLGGRQAILNEEVFDATPDNLLRGPNGQLLDVIEGPGHSALPAFEGGGGFLPGYRGTSFRGGNSSMQAGVFNSFFASTNSDDYSYTDYQTSAVMDSWISGISHGGYYGSGDSVSSWTSMVYTLD